MWRWRYETLEGREVGYSGEYPNQGDAETWLGESWRDLLAEGIDRVTMLEDDRVVYGPMSLHPQ